MGLLRPPFPDHANATAMGIGKGATWWDGGSGVRRPPIRGSGTGMCLGDCGKGEANGTEDPELFWVGDGCHCADVCQTS